MNLDKHFYFNRRKQRLFYSLLLIATPFLLLQNYLQSFIGQLSHIEFTLFDKNIPVIPTVAFILLLFLVVWLRKKFTRIRIVGWIAIFAMFWVGQYLTDFFMIYNTIGIIWPMPSLHILTTDILKRKKLNEAKSFYQLFLWH